MRKPRIERTSQFGAEVWNEDVIGELHTQWASDQTFIHLSLCLTILPDHSSSIPVKGPLSFRSGSWHPVTSVLLEGGSENSAIKWPETMMDVTGLSVLGQGWGLKAQLDLSLIKPLGGFQLRQITHVIYALTNHDEIPSISLALPHTLGIHQWTKFPRPWPPVIHNPGEYSWTFPMMADRTNLGG